MSIGLKIGELIRMVYYHRQVTLASTITLKLKPNWNVHNVQPAKVARWRSVRIAALAPETWVRS